MVIKCLCNHLLLFSTTPAIHDLTVDNTEIVEWRMAIIVAAQQIYAQLVLLCTSLPLLELWSGLDISQDIAEAEQFQSGAWVSTCSIPFLFVAFNCQGIQLCNASAE